MLCLFPAVSPAGDAETQANQASSEPHFHLKDGRRLTYREYGSPSGRLVFYFHGIFSSRYEAELIADEITDSGLRVIALDRPGIGGSTYIPNRTILDWVEDVKQVADLLGYENRRFGILSVSGGGSYGLACAHEMPERISHLALVSVHTGIADTGCKPAKSTRHLQLVAKNPPLARMVLGIQRDKLLRRPELIVPWYQENWIAADAKAFSRISNKEQKLILNAQTAIRQKPRTFVDDIGLLGKEWGFDISNVTGVSVSIWSGDSDIVVPPEMAELLHRQISGSSFVIGPGEGHASMLKNHAPSILSKF